MTSRLLMMTVLIVLAGCGGGEEQASTPEKADATFAAGVLRGEWVADAAGADHPARLVLAAADHLTTEAGPGRWTLAGRDTLCLRVGTGPEERFLIRGLSGTGLTLVRPGQEASFSYSREE